MRKFNLFGAVVIAMAVVSMYLSASAGKCAQAAYTLTSEPNPPIARMVQEAFSKPRLVRPEPPVVPADETPEAPAPVDTEMLEQLAIGVYCEAGGDAICDECRLRVGDVMLNRVADDRFPDTLEEVLLQKRQYGTFHWTGIVWPERAGTPEEAHAVERAYSVAAELLQDKNHSDLYGQGYIFQSEFPNLGSEAVQCCGIYYAKG